MRCESCGETSPEGASWCEACGADLAAVPSAPCVSCGAREVAEDGYCMACGHKQPAERDHMEFVDGPVAAVTDRGRRHHHNEDAVALGVVPDGRVVLVVCDGVSSTPGSDEASLAAATAARDLLVTRLGAEPDTEPAEVLEAAVAAAQEGAAAVPEFEGEGPYGNGGPPSSTFVAAVARQDGPVTHVSLAWLGDSRAYWIGTDGAVQLTEDHEIGGSLIRWLGADSPGAVPDMAHIEADGEGLLLVCTDGLWRYGDTPERMAELVTRLRAEATDLVALAASLVAYAVECGGHDNITAAVWVTEPVGATPAVGPPAAAAPAEG